MHVAERYRLQGGTNRLKNAAFGQTTPLLMMRRLFLRWQMHATLAAACTILRASDGTMTHRLLGLTHLLARSESMIEHQNAGF